MSKQLICCSADGCDQNINIDNQTDMDYLFDIYCDGRIHQITIRNYDGYQEG